MATNLPQRKSPRLKDYDYTSSGTYFVTICTHERQQLFGQIQAEIMQLSELGNIATACWQMIPTYYSAVTLDAFIVMPNHVHGILVLADQINNPPLGRIVNAYKGAVTKRANQPSPIWQGRFHDHIIRNEKGLDMIRDYVQTNPHRWEKDIFYG